METTTFEDIVRNVDRVLNLAQALGLGEEVNQSRFIQYRDRLAKMIETKRVADPMLDGIAQVEAHELSAMAEYLESCEPDAVRDKLMHALRGPYLPVEEDDGSNEGRNFMFELAMAAKLWRAGLAPSLGEHPEIQCLVGDTPLYMQCKRVFVEHRVARCLERARGQLKSDLANGPAEACGLVAISLSRVLNAGDRVLEFSDADEASQHVERMLRELESRARAFRRRRARTPRILGVLFQASTPAAERQSGLIARLENMLLESMLPSVGDGQTLHDLNARLKIALRPRS